VFQSLSSPVSGTVSLLGTVAFGSGPPDPDSVYFQIDFGPTHYPATHLASNPLYPGDPYATQHWASAPFDSHTLNSGFPLHWISITPVVGGSPIPSSFDVSTHDYTFYQSEWEVENSSSSITFIDGHPVLYPLFGSAFNISGAGHHDVFFSAIVSPKPDAVRFIFLPENITISEKFYAATYNSVTDQWEAHVDGAAIPAGQAAMALEVTNGAVVSDTPDKIPVLVNSSLVQPEQAPPPDITLVTPKPNETVHGTATISATVKPAPKTVKFIVQGELSTYDQTFDAITSGDLYGYDLDTTKLKNGPYTIKVETNSGISGGSLSPATHIKILNTSSTAVVPAPSSTIPVLPATSYAKQLVKLKCHGLFVAPDDPCKAVYYVGSDGMRHAFPNEKVYFSWYADFSNIVELDSLSQFSFGLNVVYRPGVRLVKFTTSNDVYAVSAKGVLRKITSETLAKQLFGLDWAKKVDDINDAFFSNYTFGADIVNATDYNAEGEMDAANSIDANF
jgi:hypothetical protein